MRFIINIHLQSKQKRLYTIDAKDETQAKERLMLRLPPKERETVVIVNITVDPSTITHEDPFGIYN